MLSAGWSRGGSLPRPSRHFLFDGPGFGWISYVVSDEPSDEGIQALQAAPLLHSLYEDVPERNARGTVAVRSITDC